MTVVSKKHKKKIKRARKESVRSEFQLRTEKVKRSSHKKMEGSTEAASVFTRKPKRKNPKREKVDSYVPPTSITTTTIGQMIQGVREIPEEHQSRFGITPATGYGVKIWVAGDSSLVRLPSVAIVGSRNVSPEGAARARRLAKELSLAGVVIVSGLAKGVDTEALTAAMEANGRTIGVIGTPLDRAYPAENKRLQEKIYREHLLVSQFESGKKVYPSNFPERNKLMAAISDVTAIVEASDESGSLHQAWECTKLKRWLFIAKSLADNPNLHWPKSFLQYPTTRVLNYTSEILDVLRRN
jgi:DNA processing protein